MKKSISIFCFVFSLLFVFYSCKKDKNPPPDMGYNYFPNIVGEYVVYDVDSIYYNSANINSNTHKASDTTYLFQIKEKVQSIYLDNQNRPTMRLERYVKYHNDTIPYSNMQWTIRNVWAENRHQQQQRKWKKI